MEKKSPVIQAFYFVTTFGGAERFKYFSSFLYRALGSVLQSAALVAAGVIRLSTLDLHVQRLVIATHIVLICSFIFSLIIYIYIRDIYIHKIDLLQLLFLFVFILKYILFNTDYCYVWYNNINILIIILQLILQSKYRVWFHHNVAE